MAKKQKTNKTKNKEKGIIKINTISNNYYYNSEQNQAIHPESITKDMGTEKIKELLKNLKVNHEKMEKEYYMLLADKQSKQNKKMEKLRDQMKKIVEIVESNKKETEKIEKKPKKNVMTIEKKKNKKTISNTTITESVKSGSNTSHYSPPSSITVSVKNDSNAPDSSPPSSVDTKEAKKKCVVL